LTQDQGDSGGIAEEETLRAEMYALLGWLLKAPPSTEDLRRAAALGGDDSELGRAISALAATARASTSEAIDEEFQTLFIGLGRGALLPYGSYYMSGFLNEKPLANLRIDMDALGIGRADDIAETEDHIAALCDMMAGLITGAFGAPAELAAQQRFFDAHIAPWAPTFFEDLEAAASAAFYMPVGAIGRAFMRIEAQAFQMAA
jgi:TorA maturation chaperone TorD